MCARLVLVPYVWFSSVSPAVARIWLLLNVGFDFRLFSVLKREHKSCIYHQRKDRTIGLKATQYVNSMICTSVFLLPAVLLALKITEGIITHCNNEVFVNDNYELDITLIKPSSRNQMVFFQYYILDLTLPVLKSCREILFVFLVTCLKFKFTPAGSVGEKKSTSCQLKVSEGRNELYHLVCTWESEFQKTVNSKHVF